MCTRWHKWYVFDLVVVYVALLGDTVLEQYFDGTAELISGLRLWRIVSLLFDIALVKHERNEMVDDGAGSDSSGRRQKQSAPLQSGQQRAPPPPFSSAEEAASMQEQQREAANLQELQRAFPDHHHHEPARTWGLEGLSQNAPVFFLPWFFFTMCLCGLAFMCEALICSLILIFSMGLPVLFMVLSRGRGMAWACYNVFCLFSSLLGGGIGYLHRTSGGDELLTRQEVYLVFLLVFFYFFLMMLISMLLPRFGIQLVGSSAAFANQKGWGWNPLMLPHLHFGFDKHGVSGADLVDSRVHPKSVALGLLHHRCYWSGEPVMDYTFFICNESSFLSCFLSHPANAYGFLERSVALMMLIPLIVFPISLIDFLFPGGGITKIVVNLAIFIFPRYLLKLYVKELCTLSDQIHLGTTSGDLDHSALTNINVFADLHALRKAARPKDALRREVVFFFVLGNATICQAVCISLYIQSWSGQISKALWNSYEGLVYAFVLELILLLVVPHKLPDGQWVIGFFGQWWTERLRPEYGGKRGSPLRSSLAGAPVMNDPMQMW